MWIDLSTKKCSVCRKEKMSCKHLNIEENGTILKRYGCKNCLKNCISCEEEFLIDTGYTCDGCDKPCCKDCTATSNSYTYCDNCSFWCPRCDGLFNTEDCPRCIVCGNRTCSECMPQDGDGEPNCCEI